MLTLRHIRRNTVTPESGYKYTILVDTFFLTDTTNSVCRSFNMKKKRIISQGYLYGQSKRTLTLGVIIITMS